ncbi:MAG: selenocysteine-specific translation elongation factor, partial [Nocardioidaceae bacterium]
MHVIATAGHVDHGKSTLIRALTGTDPDRLAEEHRRGLTITLGYCWTQWTEVGEVAFVDVPGHERFISTTLAGLGPVPAALLVVAADDLWMPQTAEHLAALNALGVTHGVVAITRTDVADPAPAMERARAEMRGTTLQDAPMVPVSGVSGEGIDALRDALMSMVGGLEDPDRHADVRLWVDRRFSVAGAGAVVTGTLPAGRVRVGDSLAHADGAVRVRSIQSLDQERGEATGVARVALALGGNTPATIDRGQPLVTPGAWLWTPTVDVRTQAWSSASSDRSIPQQPLLYVGSAVVSVHARRLGDGLARLRLDRSLPLRVGDRVLLRDPGDRRMWGAIVLDPDPPGLRRRGAAQRRAAALASHDGTPDAVEEVSRRGLVSRERLRVIGVPDQPDHETGETVVDAGGWLLDRERAETL